MCTFVHFFSRFTKCTFFTKCTTVGPDVFYTPIELIVEAGSSHTRVIEIKLCVIYELYID